MRDVIAAFSAPERESAKMGLAVNEGKMKYMLSTSRVVPRVGSLITAAALGVFEKKVLTASEPNGSCMTSSMPWTLLSVVISSDSAGAPSRGVFDEVVGGQRRVGRPRTRGTEQLNEALTSLGVTN